MKMTLKAAAALALAAPFSATLLFAQTTGVSRPEEIPITTTSEGIAQPIVYTPTPTAALKVRNSETVAVPAAPVEAAPAKTFVSVIPEPAAEEPEEVAAASDRAAEPFLTSSNATDNHIVTRVAGPANALPVGTMLKVRLAKELTTKTTREGTEFSAELADAVLRDGRVLLPAGSMVSGVVTGVHGGKRISGTASIHLRPETVTLPDGTKVAIKGQVIDTEMYRSTRVDGEGTIVRKDHALKTAAAFGLSTGSGAAAGAVFGGWPGAVIGAGIGAGVSTVVWLKQDRQADLPVGTKLVFALTSPAVFGEK